MKIINAEIKIKDLGILTLDLYPEKAPQTVSNFVNLAEKGFYDDLIFHRVIANFVAQGGDPEGTGMGGPGYHIKGEFPNNRFDNDLKHKKGAIAMARSQLRDSAGSQFYLCLADFDFLDGEYAVFGYVQSGMEILEHFQNVATNSSDRPLVDIEIETITIDRNGNDIEELVKL